TLNENTSFIVDLNADSLDLVELIMALETELNIEADDEDLENIETIGDCINFVKKSI
ncbi:MAG: acyl carrier protein, partial [Ezakiella sp.]